MIREFRGKRPVVHPAAIIDSTALVMGNVVIEEGATIWPHALLRADEARIVVKKNACILDKAFVEAPRNTIIGERSLISHGAIVHGSIIGNDVLVGMGAIVMEVEVGSKSMVAAGSVVRENVEPGVVVAGVPAKKIRDVSEDDMKMLEKMREELAEKAAYLK
jgi:carbonic anhydrase/acetyltransferase-like protein (isoleucine patch superfamily)